jgi:acyl transferase domain-containing protein/acyl carrier protein/phosphopantetheinyl transferase
MSDLLLLCAVPAERADLAGAIAAAGGTPLVDVTASPRADVPSGAWVRVRSRRRVSGDGPVVLVDGPDAAPVRNRETWLEVTAPRAAPDGFAGIVLRGAEVGGPCGAAPGLEMVAQVPQGTRILLDAGTLPTDATAARAAGVDGVVLSDVLLGLPELGLPAGLRQRLASLEPAGDHVVNGFRFHAGPLAPVLRKLLGGAAFWDLTDGWFSADDPANRAWPIGAAAASAVTLAQTHPDLRRLLAAYDVAAEASVPAPPARPAPARPAPTRGAANSGDTAVAIIGLGCRLPGAMSVGAFWDNILASHSSITAVPVDRWDPALYWDADRSAPDKTYAAIGGFLSGFTFEPRRFRIPPAVAKHIDQVQQTTLESVYDALLDAGLKPGPRDKQGREFDRDRTAVILGNSMGGEVTDDYTLRIRFPAIRQALQEVPGFAALPDDARAGILTAFESSLKDDLPTITEDSMPGELSNVVAGRVANAFDLTGANFTVDAACASSMAAIQTAVKGLLDRDFDLAITGGADRSMGVETYTKFSKIGALSPDHSAPFDATANGFVMGEGAGILVLKRLADAQRDGDRVYAVIRGIGASSDGKGKGITAPNPRGQKLALKRAYAQANLSPAQVDLFECHGTSTVVGDKVEVECLTDAIGAGNRGARGPVRIGSVKSNIGHLKSAAGAASLIKAALAVHHGILPPSIGFQTARPDVPFDTVPLQVQTQVEPWISAEPRRAGVSAFGFGGTNFHVLLEQHTPDGHTAVEAVATPPRPVQGVPLPEGIWAISARDRADLVALLKSGNTDGRPFEADAPVRLAAAAQNADERTAQHKRVLRVLQKDQPPELLRSRGIALEEEPCDGKLAFMFTGQGSQYIDMGLDLAARYSIMKETFDEADRVMLPELDRPLTDFIRRDPSLSEEVQFERLRATEISQPATLTVDIGITRLLASFGVRPDMVAGHSLGEYAAAVASGMLSFEDALLAVSARGREMAAVKIDDPGRMAGIATSVEKVQEILAELPGYVVCANKNCPTQTVIAGGSDAVEAAIEAFRSRGITVYPLPVSHAFHTRIVAPASEPLRRVLERLDVRPPVRPVTTNVTSRYYPTGPDARTEIIDILARQVASPVEWIAQTERMYADGARIFVECGPKRALSGFTASILKRRPHRVLYTNHPKRGGTASFEDSLAALLTLGFPLAGSPGAPDLFAESEPRRATSAKVAGWNATGPTDGPAPSEASKFVVEQVLAIASDLTGYATEELSLQDELEADLGVDTVKQAELVATVRDHFRLEHDPAFRLSDYRTLRDLANYAARRLGSYRSAGTPPPRTRTNAPTAPTTVVAPPPRHATLAMPVPQSGALPTDALQALIGGAVAAGLSGGDAEAVGKAVAPALQSLVAALVAATTAVRPAPKAAPTATPTATNAPGLPAPAQNVGPASQTGGALPEVVASGVSVGLPGGDEVFAADNFDRILAGENRISPLSEQDQDRILAKNIVRLHKDPRTGQGTFHPVDERDQVLHLAGQKSAFDLTDYGVDPSLLSALDITTQLAIAAGLEALRDAGIPLVRRFRETAKGKRVPAGWGLPDAMRDETGIIFACAFPGYSNLLEHIANNGADGEGRFDRRFLFQILSMGHSQLAQFIGARGPNTQVNAACASSTQAISIASDWIQTGRCRRVLVVGADDVTNEQMMEWIGAGFLVTGAATTEKQVEDAALPFDQRRNGMIIGMGAVGVVVEAAAAAKERGVTPLARLLASRIANSAFHGTRLDRDHIAAQVDAFVEDATRAAGVDRTRFAERAVFMSHETYTPARGGSAAAEIDSLRRAFGDAASSIVIANTKGYTGHAMGAGIEDAVALEALSRGIVPPVPNLREPDPELGDLILSTGGHYDLKYAIRLAAGFGSQLALTAWEKVADGPDHRVNAAQNTAWLRQVTGFADPELVVEARTLRVIEPEVSKVIAAPSAAAPPTNSAGAVADALAQVTALIADRMGYGTDELEADFELEADLGIDTVKQAEILSELRESFDIPPEVEVTLSDTPTIIDLATWLAENAPGGASPAPAEAAPIDTAPQAEAAAPTADAPEDAAPVGGASDHVEQVVLEIIADKTGYDTHELESDFELEADLGIDTVKQAEIFGDVRERLGVEQDEEFRLADYPTIGGLVGWLRGKVDAALPGTAPEAAEDTPAAAAPPVSPPADTAYSEPTVDERGLPLSFRIRRPIIVPRGAPRPPGRLDGRCLQVLGEGPFAIALRLEALEAGATLEGVPDAVLDCGSDVREAFRRARELDGARPRDWICVTRLGSDPSWIDPEVGMVNGARVGLAKALNREWPECAARMVDVDPTVDDTTSATKILAELTAGDGSIEIFHDNNVRRCLELQIEEAPPQGGRLQDGSVIVLTGGTRGITARVALALASRGPVRLALLARTAPGAEPLDEDAAKAEIRDELQAQGERGTPAQIEARLRPLRSAEEARANIGEMTALGAEVRFYPVDMADEDAVRDVLQTVRDDLGFIDGVVHGAGVEVSRLIAEKTDDDFAHVFDAKARGGMALARNLERVAWFVSMGSVAGRFGNAGQVDYSAANEAMARVCLSRPRSLHVDWTAWADTGMAVRGGMERLLTDRGVELLPADAGANLLVDLITSGVTGEVVVAGALGGFPLPPAHPLLDSIELVGDRAIGRRCLSLDADPWLEDHSIEGTPVLPGVIGVELMAAVARFARPGTFFMGARDVAFSAPVKLHKGEPTDLIITAEPLDDHHVRCVLESERTARTGRTLRTTHFEAVIAVGLMEAIDPLPPAFFAEEPLTRDDIYRRFFHGPVFRVLAEAESVGETALMATAVLTHAPVGDGLLTAPLVLEAAFQAAGLHRMATRGLMALPASIDLLQLDHVPTDGAPLSIMVSTNGDAYDIDVDSNEGNVLRVRGFRMVDTGPLPEGDRIPEPDGGWPVVVMATAMATGGTGAAEALLPVERREIAARGTAKRQADRTAGRRAARGAVNKLTGDREFRIGSAQSGAPEVRGCDGASALDGVKVSITHRDGHGWAAATRHGTPGLDVEAVALRPASWLRTWFTSDEQARLAGDPVAQTRTWCAKEAVLKALGTGMALHPKDVEILDQRRFVAKVILHREAAERHAQLGGGRLIVTLGQVDGLVAAAALLAPGDGRNPARSRRVA